MADTKTTALTELTAAASTDLLFVVDDPAGTPVSKKITVSNLVSNLDSSQALGWSDVIVLRGAADTLEQRNGTNAQTVNIYGTYTDASNYNRIRFAPEATSCAIYTESLGSGGLQDLYIGTRANRNVYFVMNDAGRWRVTQTTGDFNPVTTKAVAIGGTSKLVTRVHAQDVYLDLETSDQGFIDFNATVDADATSAISSLTTSGSTTHHIQIEINGTKAWIAASTNAPS